jgi:hypothetical protein
MRLMLRAAMVVAAMMVVVASHAWAEPVTQPLKEAEGWSALEQRPARNAAPDACMIVEADAAVALRSIGHSIDFMIANAHWDLLRDMRPAIRVTIGSDAVVLPVTGSTSNTAIARIDPSVLPALLLAMNRGRSMRVVLFSGMPVTVPLQGFAVALPAFRHCAGLK